MRPLPLQSVVGNISTFGAYAINPDDASVTLRIVGSSFPNCERRWPASDRISERIR